MKARIEYIGDYLCPVGGNMTRSAWCLINDRGERVTVSSDKAQLIRWAAAWGIDFEVHNQNGDVLDFPFGSQQPRFAQRGRV